MICGGQKQDFFDIIPKNMILKWKSKCLNLCLLKLITTLISVQNLLFWGIKGLGNKSSLFAKFIRLDILCWTAHTQTKGTSRVRYMHIRF
jgi:hypothetical protein